MKLVKSALEALAIALAIIAIVGGLVAFVAFAAVVGQRINVWLFPVMVLGLYLLVVYAVYRSKKGGKHREVLNVGRDNTKPGGPSSVVKLDDLTVARAIQEAGTRKYDGPNGAA